MQEFCSIIPKVAYLLQLVQLSLTKFVSYFFQSWKERYFFLEHDNDHPSLGGANFVSTFLSVIKTEKFKILNTMKLKATCSFQFFDRVMSFMSIGSLSDIVNSSSNFKYLFCKQIYQLKSIHVNCSFKCFNLFEIVFARIFVSLVVKFKLKAVQTVKLNPLSLIFRTELPCPIEITRSLEYFDELVHDGLININFLLDTDAA